MLQERDVSPYIILYFGILMGSCSYLCSIGGQMHRLRQWHFFVAFSSQVHSMLPCVCSVIDHRWLQNVVRQENATRGRIIRAPIIGAHKIRVVFHTLYLYFFYNSDTSNSLSDGSKNYFRKSIDWKIFCKISGRRSLSSTSYFHNCGKWIIACNKNLTYAHLLCKIDSTL